MRAWTIAAIVAVLLPIGGMAQDGRNPPLSDLLRRLQREPAYAGRVVGTHTVRSGAAFLYEVRILSRDDRIVIVYLDPATGAVVRDPDAWLARSGNR